LHLIKQDHTDNSIETAVVADDFHPAGIESEFLGFYCKKLLTFAHYVNLIEQITQITSLTLTPLFSHSLIKIKWMLWRLVSVILM